MRQSGVFANFVFPLEEALPKAEAEAEIAKENEEKALCEERAGQLADDKDALADHFGECVQALEAEKSAGGECRRSPNHNHGAGLNCRYDRVGSILAQATDRYTLSGPASACSWRLAPPILPLRLQARFWPLFTVFRDEVTFPRKRRKFFR